MEIFKERKILITGGLGFIGSNLAKALLQYGAKVTLVDSLIPEYGGNLQNVAGFETDLKINVADVRDSFSMNHLVKGYDYLFNLAGQTSHQDSMAEPFIDLDINARAQLSILEACRKFNSSIKVIFASTRQVYGKPKYLPVDERHPLQPTDVNGINKLAGEWYHVLYNNVYGIRTSVLRLTNTYGPRMRVKDARQTFLGVWVRNLLSNEPLLIFGDGTQLRDFTFVDDVVRALLLAASNDDSYGKIFNVGGTAQVSLLELAELMVQANGGKGSYKLVPFPSERKAIDIGNYFADDRLLRSTISWEPQVSLEAGLKKTLEYYRQFSQYYF